MKNTIKTCLNKLLSIVHNNRWLCLIFVISSIIVAIIFKLQKIAPLGNNSMLDVDFFHQYGPLLNELTDRIREGKNLLFSFNTGGGIPFYRNFLNYLSSPFNILLLLFKKENIIMAYSIIIGLKLVFASCTMTYYLKKSFKKDGPLTLVFGLLYAFSGYFCAFYWNIMWLDGIVFLPLIMLGINKIIKENNPYFYIIFLAIMLFANYFIGYMICIFSVLYFIGMILLSRNIKFKSIIKKTILFIVSSLLAGGLAAFMLLPLAISLKTISATGGAFPAFEINFTILDFIFNHISGVSRTVFASDPLPLPNVYCGLITLVLLILLFLNKKISIRVKAVVFLCLLTFFLCFDINTLDFIWHAFHVPNDLPWRYSFLYVFCLTTIGYYSATKLKEVGVLKVSLAFAIIMIIIMLSAKMNFKNITDEKALLCMIILLIYYLLFFFTKISSTTKKLGLFLLIIISSIEIIYGINSNWKIDHDIDTFMADKGNYEALISSARKHNNDLYRMEKASYVTLNDPAWYGYYGISTFSSMAYESVSSTQRMLGLGGNTINSYYYNGYQTPIYNTMFNINYIMGNSINSDDYKTVDGNETANLVEYKYPSSIAYGANKRLKNWNLISYNPFYNQSNFAKLLVNDDEDVFIPIKVIKTDNVTIRDALFNENSNGVFDYELNIPNKSFDLYLDNSLQKDIYIYVGGAEVNSFYVNDEYHSITSDEYYIIDVGTILEDEIKITINLSSNEEGSLYFYAYTLDNEVFNNFYNKIDENKLHVTSYKETYINGNITLDKDQFVFTTLSYDDGWDVYVDGIKAKTYKVADAFLGFDAPSGKHSIKIVYYPRYMKIGLLITFISFIITFFALPFSLKRLSKREKKYKKDKFTI